MRGLKTVAKLAIAPRVRLDAVSACQTLLLSRRSHAIQHCGGCRADNDERPTLSRTVELLWAPALGADDVLGKIGHRPASLSSACRMRRRLATCLASILPIASRSGPRIGTHLRSISHAAS